MGPLGQHLVAELSGCRPDRLSDLEGVRQAMLQAAAEAGAEVLDEVFHPFEPQGVSGVVVLSESHLSIHTWPELGYAALDIYTCGPHTRPSRACDHMVGHLEAARATVTILERGLPGRPGAYGHAARTVELEGGAPLTPPPPQTRPQVRPG